MAQAESNEQMELGNQGRPADSSRAAIWQRVESLLLTGQYAAAGRALQDALLLAEKQGDADLSRLLSAATTLCHACDALDSAQLHYQQAAEDVAREHTELHRQLLQLLGPLRQEATADPAFKQDAGPGEARPDDGPALQRKPAPGNLFSRLLDLLSPSSATRSGRPQRPEPQSPSVPEPSEAARKRPSPLREQLPRDLVNRTRHPEYGQIGLPIPRRLRLFILGRKTAAREAAELAESTESPEDTSAELAGGPAQRQEQRRPEQVQSGAETPGQRVRAEELAESSGPTMAVYCLGPFRVYLQDTLIEEWLSLKGLTILKYLAAQNPKPAAKDILIDLLWPESDPEAGRRNLHQAVYALRQTLRQYDASFPYIKFHNDSYLLNPAIDLWIDALEFGQRVDAGRRLLQEGRLKAAITEFGAAEGLYQGSFLEEDRYEEWTSRRRRQLRALYLQIADRLSDYYQDQGQFGAAVTLCQKALRQDDCHEAAHQHLMACYLALGQRHLALRQYRLCVQKLQAELDLPPSSETQALYQQITRQPG